MCLQPFYRAKVVSSRITVGGKEYVTYGIAIHSADGYAVVHDISVDRREVAALCRRIRRGRLAPCHLQAVAEDFVDR